MKTARTKYLPLMLALLLAPVAGSARTSRARAGVVEAGTRGFGVKSMAALTYRLIHR